MRTVQVEVHYGDPGTGKSYKAYTENTNVYKYYKKNGTNMWFDGYDGETTLVIEEFDGYIPIQTFLQLLDPYQMQMEIKGGTVYAKWNKVIIISNYPPNTWYPTLKPIQIIAMLRRIDNIYSYQLPANVVSSKVSYKEAIIRTVNPQDFIKIINDYINSTVTNLIN